MPRPTRRRAFLLPSAGLIELSCMCCPEWLDQRTRTRYETLFTMPRTAGVSCSSRTLLTRRSPRPRTVSLCDCLQPIGLRTSLTFKVLMSAMTLLPWSAEDLFDRLAALGGDLSRCRRVLQRIERGAHHVVRVGQIGRASCRERVWIGVVAVRVRETCGGVWR